MAKATLLEDVPITPPPDVFNLTLSREEAGVLLKVVGMIIGSDSGPRGITSRIFWALRDVGVVKADIRVIGDLRLEAK